LSRIAFESERSRSQKELEKVVRDALKPIPGIDVSVGFNRPIWVNLLGPDPETLSALMKDFAQQVSHVPGIADLETVREPGPRLIGNVSIEVDLGEGPRVIAGFENHGGRTHLGKDAEPLGRVLHGHGNNDRDGYEGVKRMNMIGTYLHGPLLPKNAWLADRLIGLAIERRTGERPELEPLGDELEMAAHRAALHAAERG
jgi:CobQ-like glutamine amidotransferase family enzyme